MNHMTEALKKGRERSIDVEEQKYFKVIMRRRKGGKRYSFKIRKKG